MTAADSGLTGASATVRLLADTTAGSTPGLVCRLIEVTTDAQVADVAESAQLWYVLGGNGRLSLPDEPGQPDQQLGPDQGLLLRAGTRYRVTAAGPGLLRLHTVTLPGATDRQSAAGATPLARQLAECAVETTGDRRFRVLFGPGRDCPVATQFVGEIPPGRAPEHSHPYDEVVLILDGEGIAHANDAHYALAAGSCVHLPPGVVHCLENTGRDTLRVLGVFHPADSPAAKLAPADEARSG
ncbi:MAG TPA: cupin domain-containing protein [Streptosporangiaceae bacterium]|nr:cupin domain-containing protein [Streptosporangiaceae bacterium]